MTEKQQKSYACRSPDKGINLPCFIDCEERNVCNKCRGSEHWEVQITVIHQGNDRHYLRNRQQAYEKENEPEQQITPAMIEENPKCHDEQE